MNAQPFLVTYGVSSALSRRFGDYSLMWIAGPCGVSQDQTEGTSGLSVIRAQSRDAQRIPVLTGSLAS
jgi:hypothetical protein